jgi:hypothetical protein
VSTLCQQHNGQRPEYYTQVKQRRHIVDIKKVEDDHIVKVDGAPSCHLPKAGASRDDRKAATMPVLVLLKLVWQARPRAYQAHLAAQNIKELRQLVEARLS